MPRSTEMATMEAILTSCSPQPTSFDDAITQQSIGDESIATLFLPQLHRDSADVTRFDSAIQQHQGFVLCLVFSYFIDIPPFARNHY